jgi:hypothetical protein
VSPVQHLSHQKIWFYALELLLGFQLQYGRIESPPVPLDEILNFLGLELEFDDIAVRFERPGHLGFISPETRQIFIDQSLDPFEHPDREGRLNYTIAHEIAHWRLHRLIPHPHLLSVDDNHWLEWQANCFATCLLMPGWLVRREWKATVGRTGPVIITPEKEAMAIEILGSRKAYIEALADQYAAQLAPLFKVSREAMRNRLWELQLLPRH